MPCLLLCAWFSCPGGYDQDRDYVGGWYFVLIYSFMVGSACRGCGIADESGAISVSGIRMIQKLRGGIVDVDV